MIQSSLCLSRVVSRQLLIFYLIHFQQCKSRHYTFYPVTLKAAFLTAPALIACLSCLTAVFFLYQCFEYLLYLVFEYCLHSFITYQTLWTYYREPSNNRVSFSLSPKSINQYIPFNQLIQLRLLRPKLNILL